MWTNPMKSRTRRAAARLDLYDDATGKGYTPTRAMTGDDEAIGMNVDEAAGLRRLVERLGQEGSGQLFVAPATLFWRRIYRQ
jgi:hypothetical protein